MYANRDAAQLLLESQIFSLFDLDNPDLIPLKQHFGVGDSERGRETENALLAYQALTNGISQA